MLFSPGVCRDLWQGAGGDLGILHCPHSRRGTPLVSLGVSLKNPPEQQPQGEVQNRARVVVA